MQTIDEIELDGFELLRQERWREARECFQQMLSLPMPPIRHVKVLRNILGTYERDGMIAEAIETAHKALEIIDIYRLYETPDGPWIRGEMKGRLARLKGESIWSHTPPYSEVGPQEMNLSFANQLRARFASAAIGAAFAAAIDSQLPFNLYIEVGLHDGQINLVPLLGLVIAWFATNNILESASNLAFMMTGKDKHYCLHAGLNILSLGALVNILVMPFILPDVISEAGVFLIFLTAAWSAIKLHKKS